MRVAVLGAGAWGTALATVLADRHDVVLWARDAEVAQRLASARENLAYLPGIPLAPAIRLAAGPVPLAARDADLLIVATPMAGLRGMLRDLRGSPAPLAWLSKGFEQGTGRLGHEILDEEATGRPPAVLSGPSFALEVARRQPAALVAASPDAATRDALVRAVHGPQLRVYANGDITGVEIGGAVKNVLAIAAGLCDGLDLGMNARAALLTRGLAEMTRLGVALGARPATFMGLAGMGDLILTATGDLSRNRRVGLLLAQGRSLPEIVASLGHVAEGALCAAAVAARAHGVAVDMPIVRAVVEVLEGRLRPREAVEALMARESREEGS